MKANVQRGKISLDANANPLYYGGDISLCRGVKEKHLCETCLRKIAIAEDPHQSYVWPELKQGKCYNYLIIPKRVKKHTLQEYVTEQYKGGKS